MGKNRHDCDDRELLIRIDERTEAQENRLENHGKRLGRLEKWRTALVASMTVLGCLVLFVVSNFDTLVRIFK